MNYYSEIYIYNKKVRILLQQLIYMKFTAVIDADVIMKKKFLTNYLKKCIYGIISQSDNINKTFLLAENIIKTNSYNEKRETLFNVDYIIILSDNTNSLHFLTDIIALYEVNQIKKVPIYLIGCNFWNSLKSWFEYNNLVWFHKYIYMITDDINSIIKDIKFRILYNKKVKINIPMSNKLDLMEKGFSMNKSKIIKPLRKPPRKPPQTVFDQGFVKKGGPVDCCTFGARDPAPLDRHPKSDYFLFKCTCRTLK